MYAVKSFGSRLKELRDDADLTQKDLAERVGVSRDKICDWEKERSKPKSDDIIALADALDTSCDMLLRNIRPEFLDIHKEIGLSDIAINKLKFYENSDFCKSEGLSLSNLISCFLESTKVMDFVLALYHYKNAAEKYERQQFFRRQCSKEECVKIKEKKEEYNRWAVEYGFTVIAPINCKNYYHKKMAEIFVKAIEEGMEAREQNAKKSFDEALELIRKELEEEKNK